MPCEEIPKLTSEQMDKITEICLLASGPLHAERWIRRDLGPTERDELNRPFPWKCLHCGKKSVVEYTMDYSATKLLNGKRYKFTVKNMPVGRCGECGEIIFHIGTDAAIQETFNKEVR